jgi:hypothetical protein
MYNKPYIDDKELYGIINYEIKSKLNLLIVLGTGLDTTGDEYRGLVCIYPS